MASGKQVKKAFFRGSLTDLEDKVKALAKEEAAIGGRSQITDKDVLRAKERLANEGKKEAGVEDNLASKLDAPPKATPELRESMNDGFNDSMSVEAPDALDLATKVGGISGKKAALGAAAVGTGAVALEDKFGPDTDADRRKAQQDLFAQHNDDIAKTDEERNPSPTARADSVDKEFGAAPATKSSAAPGMLPDVGEGADYEKFRNDIMRIESGGNPDAVNPESGAHGKYQFMPRYWDKKAQEKMGKRVQELSPDEQDAFFKIYYEEDVIPAVKRMREEGLGGAMSDRALAGLVHRSGEGGAREYLQTGTDKYEGVQGNPHVQDYLAKLGEGKGMDFRRRGGKPKMPGMESKDADHYATLAEKMMGGGGGEGDGRSVLIGYGGEPGDKAGSFDDQLTQIRDEFKQAKTDLQKMELADKLADAFAKIGAGMQGASKGIDMSGLKLERKDYSKDYDNLINEFNANLGDLKARRGDDLARRDKAADMYAKNNDFAAKKAGLAIDLKKADDDAAYKRGMLDLYGVKEQNDKDKDEATKKKQENDAWAKYQARYGKEAGDYKKKWDEVGQEIAQITGNKGVYKGLDTEEQQAQIVNTLTSKVGVPLERAKEIASPTSGFLFWESPDQAAISNEFNKIAQNEYKILKAKSLGYALVRSADGKTTLKLRSALTPQDTVLDGPQGD